MFFSHKLRCLYWFVSVVVCLLLLFLWGGRGGRGVEFLFPTMVRCDAKFPDNEKSIIPLKVHVLT